MINTKKMITLGVLAVTGLGLMGTTTVQAAMTGGGTTKVTYEPGKSTGGDGSGTVADWTVDFPISVSVGDDSTNQSFMSFKLLNTGTENDYNKTHNVTVSLKDNYTSGGLSMTADTGSGTASLILTKDGSEINSKDSILTLSSQKTNDKIGAYAKASNVSKGDKYSKNLTWTFTGNEG